MQAATGELIKVMTLATCLSRPDVPIKVPATGARTETHIGQHHRWLHTLVFCRGAEHDCIRAVLVNAVHVLNRADAETLLSLVPICNDIFNTINTSTNKFFPHYILCLYKIGTLRPDDWIIQQSEGVFLLVITGEDPYGDEH